MRAAGRREKERSENTAFGLPGPFLGAPRGVCYDIPSFFFLNQNEKCRFYVRIIENFKLGGFHGPLEGAAGKIGGQGVF